MAKVSWIWRETAEVLGVLGVVGSLIFVAFEIQQNNELLAAEARATRHANRSQNSNRQFLENPELAELVVKANSRAQLTQVEQFTIERYFNQKLLDFQFSFVEFDERDLDVDAMTVGFNQELGMLQYWNEHKRPEFQPDFVQWMEENVVNER